MTSRSPYNSKNFSDSMELKPNPVYTDTKGVIETVRFLRGVPALGSPY